MGAYGFFALPYTIVVYPFVFMVMPVLWRRARDFGYVTAGDVVHGQYGSRGLELAVAATGVIATMPYIALQLVGMTAALKALGLHGEVPLAMHISDGESPESSCVALLTWRSTPGAFACSSAQLSFRIRAWSPALVR